MMLFVLVVGYDDTFYGVFSEEKLAYAAAKEYGGDMYEVKCVELDNYS